jgi:hypothetical protein
VGDVSPRGFEALRLSIWGAWRLFGAAAGYVVCVNGIAPEEARGRTGPISAAIGWRVPGEIPDHIRRVLDAGMAEGVAWKFAPLRLFPDRHELALDNDCIVWAMPEALRAWLQGGDRCLTAEGVRLGFGQFPDLCGPEPRNSGIRGLPPGFDLGDALAGVLARPPTKLRSELDEQGLQVAAISRPRPPLVVRVDEVTVCSPFHPHVSELGRCGAHFVGLNLRHIPWGYYGRPADDCQAGGVSSGRARAPEPDRSRSPVAGQSRSTPGAPTAVGAILLGALLTLARRSS